MSEMGGNREPQNQNFPGLTLAQWQLLQQHEQQQHHRHHEQQQQLLMAQHELRLQLLQKLQQQQLLSQASPCVQPQVSQHQQIHQQSQTFQQQQQQQDNQQQQQQQQQQQLLMAQHEHQLQLQKSKQHQQLLSHASPRVQPQVLQQQQIYQQSQQFQQQQLQLGSDNNFSQSLHNQPQHIRTNHLEEQQKQTAQIRAHSGLTNGGAPSSSTSPSTNRGLQANPTPQQHMRTFTKVKKRGSVGRSIDITRYKGYEELMYDLVRMFEIEGHLEEPQWSEWKLVYVDRKNDIVPVGDDPWEEFVSCVQSIKILSSAEVQQLCLVEDLGNSGETKGGLDLDLSLAPPKSNYL